MKIKNTKYWIIQVILVIGICLFAPKSEAATGFKAFNNSPRITVNSETSDLSDVKITVNDYYKIQSVKIRQKDGKTFVNEQYGQTPEAENQNLQEDLSELPVVDLGKANANEIPTVYSKDTYESKLEYILSHDKQLKDKETTLIIEVSDTKGLVIIKQVKLEIKENKKGKKYYAINSSPGVSGFVYQGGKKFGVTLKDKSGLKSVKVVDTVVNEVVKEQTLPKHPSSKYIEIDFNEQKPKQDSDTYAFTIEITDVTDLTTLLMIEFKIDPLKIASLVTEEGALFLDVTLNKDVNLESVQILVDNELVQKAENLGNENRKIQMDASKIKGKGTNKTVEVKVVSQYAVESQLVQSINYLGINLEEVTVGIDQFEEMRKQWEQQGIYDKMDSKRIAILETAFSAVGNIKYKTTPSMLMENPKELSASGFVDWLYKTENQNLNLQSGHTSFLKNRGGSAKVKSISQKERLPGDICVVMEKNASKHVGLYVGEKNGKMVFIHCCSCHKKTVMNSENQFLSSTNYWCRYTGFQDKK